jgi:thiol:disulfide interchange protein DsbD
MRCQVLVAVLVLAVGRLAIAADADVVQGSLAVRGDAAVARVTIAPGWHVNAHVPRDRFLVPSSLDVVSPPGVRVGEVAYPEPVERTLAFAGGRGVLLYEGSIELTAPLAGRPAPDAPPLRAVFRYQACDDTRCLPPRTLELVATAPPPADASPAARAAGASVGDWIARFGYPLTFLWVVLLGAGLNLTPCVYPLISVTVAFFGGRSGTDTTRAVPNAVLYVLGICLSFSTLGVAAALTGSFFGAALQQPAVLGGLALLMAALALSNFGLYQLRMPTPVVRWAGQVGEGAVGAFFMGLTMGVVAAPCIGPFVATLLLFVGARQSPALGFALFLALGLGMGAPYVALAAIAGRLRRLPRGGPWLVWMERLFGFILLAIALHFAEPLLPPAWVRFAWPVLLAAAGIALGFVGASARPVVRWARATVGVAAVAVALGTLLVAQAGSGVVWTAFSDDALARALSSGRPVLIDFEADWCLPCREMERTTFRDPEVVRVASRFATLKIDATTKDERVDALVSRYKVPGVPTYVLLGTDGMERARFVGYVRPDVMLAALRQVLPRG